MSLRNNQQGYSLLLVVLALVLVGSVGFVAWKVTDSNRPVSQQIGTNQPAQLSQEDQATLEQAKKLKKVDFDLDGQVNSQDIDDDNDGQNDDVDEDDDNDGQNDDVDEDDDNDGVNDDEDNESEQENEL